MIGSLLLSRGGRWGARLCNVALALAVFVVIDGDTIRGNGETIRLRGFDTPETRFAKCEAERRLGNIAKRKLERLLASGRVQVKRLGYKDRYGRTLASVYVDGVDVAEVMIGEEFARPYHGGPRRGWCDPI